MATPRRFDYNGHIVIGKRISMMRANDLGDLIKNEEPMPVQPYPPRDLDDYLAFEVNFQPVEERNRDRDLVRAIMLKINPRFFNDYVFQSYDDPTMNDVERAISSIPSYERGSSKPILKILRSISQMNPSSIKPNPKNLNLWRYLRPDWMGFHQNNSMKQSSQFFMSPDGSNLKRRITILKQP
jgi:hypothetical protein